MWNLKYCVPASQESYLACIRPESKPPVEIEWAGFIYFRSLCMQWLNASFSMFIPGYSVSLSPCRCERVHERFFFGFFFGGEWNETFSFSLLSTIFGVQLFLLRLFIFVVVAVFWVVAKQFTGTIDYLLFCGRAMTLTWECFQLLQLVQKLWNRKILTCSHHHSSVSTRLFNLAKTTHAQPRYWSTMQMISIKYI